LTSTLQILVMVQVSADVGDGDLLALVLRRFPGAARVKSNSCDVRGNWLEIWHNEDADQSLADDTEDGYLYYRWRVEVTPLDARLDEDHQVALARALRDCFAEAGARAVVCASFEDRV
jgi:hypothetical protein